MKEQKRAWTYSRIDAPEDAHGSLKSQKKELFDYAEQMGFAVTGSSEDLGSGLDFNRTGLLEVMKAAGDGKMDVLLVKRLDRLGRDMVRILEFLRGLDQLGIRLYSPMEGEIRFAQFDELYHELVMSLE
ncbi:site-specific recombinase, DNA invertase Pin [Desulfitobacterium dichloroeliminans LMG P-21439]|uniref:Site-specific recombinase, DNA invertase Pin n=1 Tax=Desulfitobacterium dichloroeliminans (strain LMG P-21439 / DCA1) TaxID=871963 RepID=L0F7R0_DESDL|nr:recombinase family protein [Desulfitobacterium dichloroeliminans]AGA69232.1 site-specific recombinase, DNA invertase Pin [Desulfitobacterium dichloroeliminans LMG P-21439]